MTSFCNCFFDNWVAPFFPQSSLNRRKDGKEFSAKNFRDFFKEKQTKVISIFQITYQKG